MSAATLLAEPVGPLDCYACTGRFQLAKCGDKPPVARHSEPYCPPFVAIETVVEAVSFAERCVQRAEERRAQATKIALEALSRVKPRSRPC